MCMSDVTLMCMYDVALMCMSDAALMCMSDAALMCMAGVDLMLCCMSARERTRERSSKCMHMQLLAVFSTYRCKCIALFMRALLPHE